jgi:hypothetical protein
MCLYGTYASEVPKRCRSRLACAAAPEIGYHSRAGWQSLSRRRGDDQLSWVTRPLIAKRRGASASELPFSDKSVCLLHIELHYPRPLTKTEAAIGCFAAKRRHIPPMLHLCSPAEWNLLAKWADWPNMMSGQCYVTLVSDNLQQFGWFMSLSPPSAAHFAGLSPAYRLCNPASSLSQPRIGCRALGRMHLRVGGILPSLP